jgi:hypothetical protein
VRSIYGPHICGDSLDIVNNEIVTGSWRGDNQLQLWDFGSGELIQDINWNFSSSMGSFASQATSSGPCCFLYAAQFSKVINYSQDVMFQIMTFVLMYSMARIATSLPAVVIQTKLKYLIIPTTTKSWAPSQDLPGVYSH